MPAKGNKPPGSGWTRIPKGKHGGYHRRTRGGWEHWYPPKRRTLIAHKPVKPVDHGGTLEDAVRMQQGHGVPLMVSYGGGVDSTAVLVGLHQRGIRPDAIQFADTGGENPETYAYLSIINDWLKRVGFPELTIVRRKVTTSRKTGGKYGTLEQQCVEHGTLPSLAFGGRKCSQKWKHGPQEVWANNWEPARGAWKRGFKVTKLIGYSADPADSRRPDVGDDEKYHYQYPLRQWGWDRKKAADAIASAGLPVPKKSACWFCPSTKPAELEDIIRDNPDVARRIIRMEAGAEPGLRRIEGLWRRPVQGARGATKKPGTMTEFIVGEELLPEFVGQKLVDPWWRREGRQKPSNAGFRPTQVVGMLEESEAADSALEQLSGLVPTRQLKIGKRKPSKAGKVPADVGQLKLLSFGDLASMAKATRPPGKGFPEGYIGASKSFLAMLRKAQIHLPMGPRPPGKGWSPIPKGTRGGFRRRKGKGWEYWYPGQRAAKRYVSPRQRKLTAGEAEIRRTAIALRDAEPWAVAQAVADMAPHVGPDDVLVPIPGSAGSTESNAILARALAAATGATVADVLERRRPVESSRVRRRSGRAGLRPGEHGIVAREGVPEGRVLFIDNVITTGSTVEAARQAVGRGVGLAYAEADEVLARPTANAKTDPVYFASALSNPGEIAGFAEVGMHVGASAHRVNAKVEAALTGLAGSQTQVFIDSGAFSEIDRQLRTIKPITHAEWTKRLDLYDRLAAALGPQLYFVAPDKVADQAETLRRLRTYAARVIALRETGANPMVPIQKGDLSMAEFDRQISALLGDDYIRGIPMSKDATTVAELRAFVEETRPARVHLLGVGRAKGAEALRMLAEVSPETEVSLDSAAVRSQVGTKARPRPFDIVTRNLASRLRGETRAIFGGPHPDIERWASPTAQRRIRQSGGDPEVIQAEWDKYLHEQRGAPIIAEKKRRAIKVVFPKKVAAMTFLDLLKARKLGRKPAEGQFSLFDPPPRPKPKPATARPPGKGWQPIPKGKRGGFRRRHGKGWEYWYPDQKKPKKAKPSKKADAADKAVTDAMAKQKSAGQRKKDNAAALELVEKIIREGRTPTDAERVKIAAYSGKGGISGDLNQYYTRTDIAGAMWDVIRAYGGKIERALEPACGSGVFLDQAPKGAKVTGVELDPAAAAVAEALHGNEHEVHASSLEEYTIANMGVPLDFDAVVTNAPFCVRTGDLPKHKSHFRSADRYFIDTSLDHCKDGGIVAMIVHSSVMNAKTPAAKDFRARMLARAEIVDSFRLPGEAFKHTHTQPITDVIFLRKRDSRVGKALEYLSNWETMPEDMGELGAWDQAFVDGNYYDDKPDRILGKALSSEETGWRDKVTGDPEKVAGLLRKLSAKKLQSRERDPAARKVTFEDLADLAERNDGVSEAIRRAQGDLEAAAAPPRVGNVQNVEGTRYLFIGDPPRWQKMESVSDVSQIINSSGDAAIKTAHAISEDIRTLMSARDEGEYYRARNIRRRVAERVNEWVAEHGNPGSHKSLGQLSKSAPQLLDFIACVDSNGQLSDLLSKDAAVTLKAAEVDRTDLLSVARHVARRNNGYVTAGDVVDNWETMPEGADVRGLLLASGEFALDPAGKANRLERAPLQHVEDYLTGDLYAKLDQATAEMAKGGEDAARYKMQIKVLNKRLDTKRKSLDDVPIQLRVLGWLPLKHFDAYLNSPEGRKAVFGREPLEPNDLRAKVTYDKGIYTLNWIAPPGGHEIEERPSSAWRSRAVRKTRTVAEGEIVRKSVDDYDWLKYMNRLSLRKEKAADVESHIEARFNEWLKSSDLRGEVEDLYNRTFHGEFRREYSGDALPLEGLKGGIVPHDYQNQAVRWAAETGRGILGQDVGLGKTFIAILLARLRKQQGLSKRPMVVVPKSVATNWAEETETLFPGSRVLVIGETRYRAKTGKVVKRAKAEAVSMGLEPGSQAYEDYVEANRWTVRSDNDQERNRKLASIKQNDYDLIICTKPAFDRIPLKEETTKQFEEEDFNYQRAGQLDAIREGSKTQETADKRIAKLQAAWSQDKLQAKFGHEESLVYWEDIGVDTLMADEAHAYKNLYAAKSRYGRNPKFLGGSGQSLQARKMQHMSRVVRDANPDNGVYFLTATPTKNSPLEVFNMLQHIAPEAFHKVGIENSEQFIDRFCRLEDRLVLTPPGKGKKAKDEADGDFSDEFEGAGNMVEATCVTGFQNLRELEAIMDKYMMIQTATDVGLKIPDANYRDHLVDMSAEQSAVYHHLRMEAADLDKQADPGGMFRIMDRMKKAAQDLELYDPERYQGTFRNSPKYQACVAEAAKGAAERGGQIIFCDHNASHERLKAMLVEKGLKPHEVGIINAQVTPDSESRQRIGNKFNRGEIKVVIGNTGTMGEGVNLQGKKHEHGTTDIHHLDQPWDPGTMHQRNGRGVRQGNRAEQVHVHTYLAKGSFDGFRHSTLKGKERWLDQLRSGADSINNDMEGQAIDDLEMLAMLSEDPDAALAKLKQVRADATSAWYARAAQESIDEFFKYQRKLQRYHKLEGQGQTRDRMKLELERIRRKLVGMDEILPQEIRDLVDAEGLDLAPVAVVTGVVHRLDGESRFGAKVLRPGTVIERGDRSGYKSKQVIEAVNLVDRKVKVRTWGYSGAHEIDMDALGDVQVLELTGLDEVVEALDKIVDSRWADPWRAIEHVGEAALRQASDTFVQRATEWYSKHSKAHMKVVVRTEDGRIIATDAVSVFEEPSKHPGASLVLPWDTKDKRDLVAAVVAANPGEEWSEWRNPVAAAVRSMYPAAVGKDTPMNSTTILAAAKRAHKAGKRTRKAASLTFTDLLKAGPPARPLTFTDLIKAVTPPAGFSPIPGSAHGGFRKPSGSGGWEYWYPTGKHAARAARDHEKRSASARKKLGKYLRSRGAKSEGIEALMDAHEQHAEHAHAATKESIRQHHVRQARKVQKRLGRALRKRGVTQEEIERLMSEHAHHTAMGKRASEHKAAEGGEKAAYDGPKPAGEGWEHVGSTMGKTEGRETGRHERKGRDGKTEIWYPSEKQWEAHQAEAAPVEGEGDASIKVKTKGPKQSKAREDFERQVMRDVEEARKKGQIKDERGWVEQARKRGPRDEDIMQGPRRQTMTPEQRREFEKREAARRGPPKTRREASRAWHAEHPKGTLHFNQRFQMMQNLADAGQLTPELLREWNDATKAVAEAMAAVAGNPRGRSGKKILDHLDKLEATVRRHAEKAAADAEKAVERGRKRQRKRSKQAKKLREVAGMGRTA